MSNFNVLEYQRLQVRYSMIIPIPSRSNYLPSSWRNLARSPRPCASARPSPTSSRAPCPAKVSLLASVHSATLLLKVESVKRKPMTMTKAMARRRERPGNLRTPTLLNALHHRTSCFKMKFARNLRPSSPSSQTVSCFR